MKHTHVLLLAGLMALAACSTDPATPKPDPTTMQFKSGQSQTYQVAALDTTDGEPIVPGSISTSIMTIAIKDTTMFGMSHVAFFRTVDQATMNVDSGYYSQASNGDLYSRDFGMSVINSNPLMMSFLGGPMHLGWILQSKMKADVGVTWKAFDSTILIPYPGLPIPISITLQDNATMMADTVFQISGKSYTAKHARHVVSMNAGFAGSWQDNLDTYISGELGATVLNVTHSSQASSPLAGQPRFQGLQNLMLTHN